MRIMLCKYKNGGYGEVIEFSSGRDGHTIGQIQTVPFYDSAVTFTHSLNGICVSIEMDILYKQIFTPHRIIPNKVEFEIDNLIILKPKIICILKSPGEVNTYDISKISEKNKDIVSKYLELKNASLQTVFNNFNYDIQLNNLIIEEENG